MGDRIGDKDFALASYALPAKSPLSEPPLRQAGFPPSPPADELDSTVVPLPTQAPEQPDYSRIPERVLRSGAVETLIGQNEDLMARLKVNIRRCSSLEARLSEQEREASDLRRINSSLTAQIQIICEKESALKARAEGAERVRNSLESELRLLSAFRRRILKWTKPRFKRASQIEAALWAREAELAATKTRLERATERLQEIEGSRARDQAKLVESYEGQLADARETAERMKAERAYFKERSDRLEQARMKLAEAENEAILRDRQRRELERKLNEETSRLQAEVAGFRREAKLLAAELQTSKRNELKAEAKSAAAAKGLARSEDQFESLRAVWEDLQKTCESLASRNDALARVNQELARKLREGRGALGSLAIDDPDRAAALQAARGESFDRIDSLLAEIESGFSRGKDAGLDFIEDNELPPTPA